LSEDPIGFWSGDYNFYRYVQNNPVNWIDPWGLTSNNCALDKCIRDCLQKNYGDLYDWASTLSPFSLVSLGNELYSGYASQKLKEAGLRNIHGFS
jgi:uncharacterized protein RhaS with RHS repeats